MTQLHHLETADVPRSNRAQVKRDALEERKRLATIDALRRLRQRTEAVLADLKNAATMLDYSIETELQSSPTRDPRHFAFPMTARALITRRDNLRATIAALSEELERGNHLERSVGEVPALVLQIAMTKRWREIVPPSQPSIFAPLRLTQPALWIVSHFGVLVMRESDLLLATARSPRHGRADPVLHPKFQRAEALLQSELLPSSTNRRMYIRQQR